MHSRISADDFHNIHDSVMHMIMMRVMIHDHLQMMMNLRVNGQGQRIRRNDLKSYPLHEKLSEGTALKEDVK